MTRDGQWSRWQTHASARCARSLLLISTFISGCVSSALGTGEPGDGAPPDKAATSSSDVLASVPDAPVIEAIASGPADAAEDRALDPPNDDASIDGAVPVDVAMGAFDAATEAALDGSWPPEFVDVFGQHLRLAWCGDERMDWSQSIMDDQVVGTGACADTTVAQLIERVLALFQPDAGYEIGGCTAPQVCVVNNGIEVLRHGDGFRLILVSTNGAPGMHSLIECNYFETDADCLPIAVGHFRVLQSLFVCEGAPLWGYPTSVYCDSNWPGCSVDASPG